MNQALMREGAGGRLRSLLAGENIVVAPGCHDALGARLIAEMGFEAVYIGGNASSATQLGWRDVGVMSLEEIVSQARRIVGAVDVPVICDADTGYGDSADIMRRTVEQFVRAGVAAIHIEDQTNPKRCGAMAGVRIVPLEDALQRLRWAVEARQDADMLIIARTDALAQGDYEEAIRRGRAFAKEGADLVFVEDVKTSDQVSTIARDLEGVPLMINCFETWPWTLVPTEALQDMGYKLVIFCLSMTLGYLDVCRRILQEIKARGTTEGILDILATREEYESLLK